MQSSMAAFHDDVIAIFKQMSGQVQIFYTTTFSSMPSKHRLL